MKSYVYQIAAAMLLAQVSVISFAQQGETEEPAELDELVVTAALEPLSERDVASSVTIITREEIEQRQAKYVADLLRDVPGFNVSQSGGAGSQTQVRVRGAEANHILVLVDGIRANDPASVDEFQFQYALTADVERIEIIRGPQSAVWGSDAVAGVINIIRRKDAYEKNIAGRAEYGSFDTTDLAVDGAWESGGLRLRGGVAYFDTDGTNIARLGPEKDGAENSTASLGLEYDFTPAMSLRLSGQYVDASSDFDEIDFFVTGLPVDADRVTEAERNYWRGEFRVYPEDSPWSGNVSVNYLDTDNQNFADGAWTSSTAAEVVEARARASLLLPGAGEREHRLTFALDRQDIDFSQRGIPSFFGDPNQDQSFEVNGYAAEYVGRVSEAFNWTLSGRYDDYSEFDNIGTWRIAASHRLTEDLRLRGSYGTGSKTPTFTERFGFFEDFFIGNPDLKPEESKGWELGLDSQWLEQRLDVGITYFDQELEDEIDGFVFDPVSGLFTAANKDTPSDRKGFELTAGAFLDAGFSLSASYTYTDATETGFDGRLLRELRRPKHMGSVQVNYQFVDNRGNLNLNVNHTGEQLDLFFDPITFVSETIKLDSYTVVDLAGAWRLTKALELVGRVSNLTDEEYEEVLGFVRPGRGVYAGLRGRLAF